MAILPYLFRLRPVDTFFFGGERTFGYDGVRSRENEAANYFVESNRYPQQTALLGVLRYKLLEANGWLATKQHPVPETAQDWIGRQNFRVTATEDVPFGYIHGLSPLFWLHQDTSYIMAPKDHELTVTWQTGPVASILGQGIRRQIPHVENYNPKAGITRQLINANGKPVAFDYNETTQPKGVYVAQIQEGILKTDQQTEDEQGFYKQTYYRFADRNWSFGFVAYLDEIAAESLTKHLSENGWATLGAEGRSFRLTIEPASNVQKLFALPERTKADGRLRLTLLSDAYVSSDIYRHCDFAITETVDFRSIESSTRVRNYANLNRLRKGDLTSPQKTDKYQLLERGSVLYASDEAITLVTAMLDKPRHFCQIGYNAYHVTGQPSTLFQPA